MNARIILLSLTIFAAGQALPANAQENPASMRPMAQEGGMRWDYRPNIWGSKVKQRPQPQVYVPHAVTAGSMPHSSTFLGVPPSMLKPVQKPQPVQQVQAQISAPHVAAAPFEKEFGAPVAELKAPPANKLTESPMPAARSMNPPQASSSGNVYGHLRHPVHYIAQSAHPQSLPQIQSYGGQGYTPGVYEAGSGAGASTNTSVNGRIVSGKRH